MAEPTVARKPIIVQNRLEAMTHILKDMLTPTHYKFLISGETGIGKTTLIKTLTNVLGISLELIEVPHATEEHLIQIPFIIFRPNGSSEVHKFTQQADANEDLEVEIELAMSHLLVSLQKFPKLSDQEYLKKVAKFDDTEMAIYRAFGGTETTIPDKIKRIRNKWNGILFLDEYWRHTSGTIRNVLRGILNGMIGNQHMPDSVYVVYASNMDDVPGTIEEPSLNAKMHELKLPPPTSKEFIDYLVGRHKDLKPELIDALKKTLKDHQVSYNDNRLDLESPIRTSPRRWEEVILYLNANIPIKTRHDAEVLKTNIKQMFSNEHGQTSELHKTADDLTKELIAQTGSPHHDAKEKDNTEWRHALEQQIKTKIALGDRRKYVPVISGPPGIAKTKAMKDIAKSQNLVLIHIDSSTLNPDAITGAPLPQRTTSAADAERTAAERARDEEVISQLTEAEKQLKVKFAPPSLYQSIMKLADAAHKKYLSDPTISSEKKEAWKHQKYKYLLFFDEFNRVDSPRTYNSLRRVLLDKTFGDGRKVPDDMILVAAMNPTDTKTQPLTSHVRDAIDIIDAAPSWSKFKDFLDHQSDTDNNLSDKPKEILNISKRVIEKFAEDMAERLKTDKISEESRPFYINVSGAGDSPELIYMSPRDYDALYISLVASLDWEWENLPDDQQDIEKFLSKHISDKFDHQLEYTLRQHGVEAPNFIQSIHDWVENLVPQLLISKSDTASLEGMLDYVLKNRDEHLTDNMNFINYANEYERTPFEEELTRYFDKLMAKEVRKYDIWAKKQVPGKNLEKGKLVIANELWDTLRALHFEVAHAIRDNELNEDMIDAFDTVLLRTLNEIATSVKLPSENRRELLKKAVDMVHKLKIS